MLARKPPKPKECKVCKTIFTPMPGLLKARVCSPDCAHSLAKSKRAKAEKVAQIKEKKEDRERKAALKSRSSHLKDAQASVNKYCRLRDHYQGRGCVTCGKTVDMSKDADAGHWLGRGAYPEKRFNTFNIALQCVHDNRYLGGLPLKFRDALIERYGVELVQKIEAHQPAQKWSIEYLVRLKTVFNKKVKRLERRNAHGTS
jgi:hypothetical protein